MTCGPLATVVGKSDQPDHTPSLSEHITTGDAEQAGQPSDDTSQEEEALTQEPAQPAPRDPVPGQR
jgi:hypothetical protein